MANLVSQYDNGTFEDILANWNAEFFITSSAQQRDDVEFYEGLHSVKLTTDFILQVSVPGGFVPMLRIRFPGDQFKAYKISCWVKVDAAFTDELVLFLRPVNVDTSQENKGFTVPVRASRAKLGWMELTGYFYATPPAGEMIVDVCVLMNSANFIQGLETYSPPSDQEFFTLLAEYSAEADLPVGALLWIDKITAEESTIPDLPSKQFTGNKMYYIRNVFLLSNGSDIIEIEEPIKWGDIDICIIWDELLKGYKFEFTDGDVVLEFDEAAGYSFIKEAYDTKFERMNISLKFGEFDSNNVLTILYEAQFNFESYTEGKYTIKGNVERKSFADKLRTRFDWRVDILKTTSVEGLTLETMPLKEMFLHPRILTKEGNFVYNKDFTILAFADLASFPAIGKTGRIYQALDDQKYYRWSGSSYVEIPSAIELTDEKIDPGAEAYKTTVPPFQATSNNIEGLTEPIASAGELLYSGLDLPPGVERRILFFDVYTSFRFTMGNTSGFIIAGVSIYKRGPITDGANDLFPPVAGSVNSLVSASTYGNVAGTKTFAGTVNGILEINRDEAVFIKVWVATPNDAQFEITDFRYLDTANHYLFVNEQTVSEASTAVSVRLHEAVNRQLEIILDVVEPLKSNMLGRIDLGYAANGCLSNHVTMNGLMLRKMADRPFNMSAKDWYSSLSGLACMGLSIERNDLGQEFVRFEGLEYFFRNTKIMRFTVISNYEKVPALRYMYNELEFGFRKYPQNNQQDSIEDWMTKFNYSAAMRSIKSKLEVTIDWILSAYYAEYTRLESFRENPTNAYETDNDTFLFSATDGQTYIEAAITFDQAGGEIVVEDIVAVVLGDVITIANGTGGVTNGAYTIIDIEIPYSYDKTIITVQETLPSDGAGTGDISLAVARMKAKRNEDFDITNGVKNPQSVYNLEHHIKRIVLRWAKVFNTGLVKLFGEEGIALIEGKNNIKVQTKLKDSVTCRFGSVSEPYADQDNELAPLTLQLPLFSEDIVKFDAPLTWGTLNLIRFAFEGRDPNGANYGYFEWYNLKGEVEKGYILDLKFKPTTQMLKGVFIKKYDG